MLGIRNPSSLSKESVYSFPSSGSFLNVQLDATKFSESSLFPGARAQITLKSEKNGLRAHLVYAAGSKQPSLYRECDVELVVLSGELIITNPRTNQVCKVQENCHFMIPAKCPYSIVSKQESKVFFIGASGYLGMQMIQAHDVEDD